MVDGTVRFWRDGLGWGALDSPDTPGGCWAHFSHLVMPGHGVLVAGEAVAFTYEEPGQDGYSSGAVEVRPAWVDPAYVRDPPVRNMTAYRSILSLAVDDPDDRPVPTDRTASRVVPGDQAWRACSMLMAAEIQRSLTGSRQAWNSAVPALMPH